MVLYCLRRHVRFWARCGLVLGDQSHLVGLHHLPWNRLFLYSSCWYVSPPGLLKAQNPRPTFIVAGIIQAVTNQQTGLSVITELIVGHMLPGKPIAMMMFKS